MIINYICKENTTLLTIVAIFISSFLAYYFSKKRYTFEKYHDKKLNILEEIYEQIISLRQDMREYLLFIAKNHEKSIEEKSEKLQDINKKFHTFQKFFWNKEIVLDNELASKIQTVIDKYIKISSTSSGLLYDEILKNNNANSDKYLENLDNLREFEEIQDRLKNEFRKIIEK